MKTSILLVIEKNRTTISSVIKWLTNDGKKSKIDKHAMLLIDDESDRGSINTKTDEDLTTINKRIRELLKLFEKSTYVVYTATPFANVFLSIGVAVKTKPSKSVAFEGLSFWTANQEHATQFYLALSNHTNWQLFKLVCEDLINLLDNNAITQNIALEITKRLLKWKKLFASKEDFGLEKQMGLLGELHFLKETMECLGVKEALDAWVFDTQDF
ncbi:Endonuclease [Helicobacter ailurogastricus]|uniref:Endonuclease n=1 Tax=Helicobacter ailurogastricus TaxID=1578720 RepID=A0A0K2Y4W0_9HELI|nr:Endonuclease [Helicobacter ailurogastricus]